MNEFLEEAMKEFRRLVRPLLRYFSYADRTPVYIKDTSIGVYGILQFPFCYYVNSHKTEGLFFILTSRYNWEKECDKHASPDRPEWKGPRSPIESMIRDLAPHTQITYGGKKGEAVTWLEISNIDEGDVLGLEKEALQHMDTCNFECFRGLPIYHETMQEVKDHPEGLADILALRDFKAFVAKDFLNSN